MAQAKVIEAAFSYYLSLNFLGLVIAPAFFNVFFLGLTVDAPAGFIGEYLNAIILSSPYQP